MYSPWDILTIYLRSRSAAGQELNGEDGFPHSEICGSKFAHNSPQLIAACHVLHRLCMPRHPPNALTSRLRIHTTNNSTANTRRRQRSNQPTCLHVTPTNRSGNNRSEERRVGKECDSTCRSRGSPSN